MLKFSLRQSGFGFSKVTLKVKYYYRKDSMGIRHILLQRIDITVPALISKNVRAKGISASFL